MSERIATTRQLEKGLQARGLLPANCRLVELSMTPDAALVLRYEVYVRTDQLSLVADALKEAVDEP